MGGLGSQASIEQQLMMPNSNPNTMPSRQLGHGRNLVDRSNSVSVTKQNAHLASPISPIRGYIDANQP